MGFIIRGLHEVVVQAHQPFIMDRHVQESIIVVNVLTNGLVLECHGLQHQIDGVDVLAH